MYIATGELCPSRSCVNNDCDEGATAEDAERGNISESKLMQVTTVRCI